VRLGIQKVMQDYSRVKLRNVACAKNHTGKSTSASAATNPITLINITITISRNNIERMDDFASGFRPIEIIPLFILDPDALNAT